MRDILETGIAWQEKSYNLTTRCNGAIPSDTLKRHRHTMVAEPVCVAERGRYIGDDGEVEQHLEARNDGKTNTLTTVQKDNQVAVPIRIGTIENDAKNHKFDSQQYRVYSPDGKGVTLCGNGGGLGAKTGLYAVPMRVREATKRGYVDIEPGECVDLAMPESKTRRGRAMRNKANCLTTSCDFYEYCGTLDMPIYQVRDGRITINGETYSIKLRDGCYIIRKLTVRECMRLQTVPENYEFPVSNSQAYKMLGNGWTCEVIAHILKSLKEA